MGATVFQVVVGWLQSNHNSSSHESVTDEQNRPVHLFRSNFGRGSDNGT